MLGEDVSGIHLASLIIFHLLLIFVISVHLTSCSSPSPPPPIFRDRAGAKCYWDFFLLFRFIFFSSKAPKGKTIPFQRDRAKTPLAVTFPALLLKISILSHSLWCLLSRFGVRSGG
uniref:Uncharacterized protein n=1 Tax=Sphaerodactylus townsendi TaxID=933632 RepID=A0ACB8FUL5_9SAUR